MTPHNLTLRWLALLVVACLASLARVGEAQTITSVSPRTLAAGRATLLTVQGSELQGDLRFVGSDTGLAARVEKAEAQQATVSLAVAEQVPPGPCTLWIVTADGKIHTQTLLVDELPMVQDAGNNHSLEAAQQVPNACSIEGVCDASTSDYYRLQAEAGQQLSFEVHTQLIQSEMDPVVRLYDAAGHLLVEQDDSPLGPDCRFRYEFTEAADYLLEIYDSRHAAGGQRYQLRIGDFPLVSQCSPPALLAGVETAVRFRGEDADLLSEVDFQASEQRAMAYLPARLPEGQASTWVPVMVRAEAQFVESELSERTLSVPCGVSGCLSEAEQADVYRLGGKQGQVLRFTAKTRSLNSPAMLQLSLLDGQGKVVAESPASGPSEPVLDATLPADGEYQLRVQDVLRRGGAEFGYWVGVQPTCTFAVAVKPDAAIRDQFAIETQDGACAIDLKIERFGYDGAIQLELREPVRGLKILNPLLPEKSTEARVYLQAGEEWQADDVVALRMQAFLPGQEHPKIPVTSEDLQRAKQPAVLQPAFDRNGWMILSGVPNTEAPFELAPVSPLKLARPLPSVSAPFALQRKLEAFKAGVQVLPFEVQPGWGLASKADKDTYTLTWQRRVNENQLLEEPTELTAWVYGEFQGRGRLERYHWAVEWFDPITVEIRNDLPLVRAGRALVSVEVERHGHAAQPITITVAEWPKGVSGPAKWTIGPDQNQVELELQIAKDAPCGAAATLPLTISSQFQDQSFESKTTVEIPPILESPQQLSVYPEQIVLSDPRGQQQLVVTGTSADGSLQDWSRQVRVTVADEAIAKIEQGRVVPLADGDTEVVVEVGPHVQRVPVQVANAQQSRPVEFESEVLVALSKQGCNSGACHGSPSGKGGFRLSLRAFDKVLDEWTLIREEQGRRVNTLDPERSLLLLKPLMGVEHGGGKQLRLEDAAYPILLDWIAKGAQPDPAGTPRVTSLHVYPSEKRILRLEAGGQQLCVMAEFADGRRRDVSDLVAYETSDTAIATVDENGLVTPHQRGEVAILVRFLEHIESLPLMFVEDVEGFQWQSPPTNNYVDELVYAKLRQLQYQPSDLCSDTEFLRRVYLDVIGILPSLEETQAFLADEQADKRARLIDALLQRDEYAKFWALKWGDLLKMTGKLVGQEGVYKYHRWVEHALRTNMPYDEFAKQLLTASGSTLANPPANFYRTATDMNESVETISQVFMGARLQCAKCHNHPFERWTQDNYYGLGAFFDRVQRKSTERPGEMFVFVSRTGEVKQPRTGEVMQPWLPQTGSIEVDAGEDRRRAFAQWLVAPDNPYFARMEANRIWSQLFARGIVDPIDDFRDSNPPSNAPLLDALAQDFVASGYDRRHLLRVILNSRTYQSSFAPNAFNREDETYFSHQSPRLLSAEQLLDAINHTLQVGQTFGNLPAGTLATQIPAPDVAKTDFLKVFGQPERSTVCACERAEDSNLGMAIELFNGTLIHDKLRDANNRFRRSLAASVPLEQVVRELYLAALCRPPSEAECQAALQHCGQRPEDPAAGLEDLCWALLNTDEFLFQH